MEIARIPAVADGEEFNVVKFDIPESLLNQPVVALYISTEIKEENQIFILVDMLIEPSELNAVEAVNNGCNIIAGKGMVTLNGFAGNDVVISTIDGKVVYNLDSLRAIVATTLLQAAFT